MKHFAVLAVFAPLLAACAPNLTPGSVPVCTVDRLAVRTALPETMGSRGSPPEHATDAEIAATAACLGPRLDAVFASVRDPAVRRTPAAAWKPMSNAYRASEHGMFLQVYADETAASYARYERGGRIAEGGTIVKRSFRIEADGKAAPYAVFVMERRAPGFAPEIHDWRFALYGNDGRLIGETNGEGAAAIAYCAACHQSARAQDFLLFVPPKFRLQ